MVISLSDLKDKVEKSDQILSDLVASEFDKAIRKWESESQSKWFQSIEEKLLVEVSHRIQIQRANSGNGLNREEVERLIHSALELYDSDKTGLADYALEPAGNVFSPCPSRQFLLLICLVFILMMLQQVEWY